MQSIFPLAALAALLAATPALAQNDTAFQAGPVFKDFGAVAKVDSDLPIPKGTVFKLLFDSDKGAEPGKINRTITNAARFINMQVAAGVPLDHIHVAIVLHGAASWDLTKNTVYRTFKDGQDNGSRAAITQLLAHGAQIYLCGQSAAGLGIAKSAVIPGVKIATSAMTADALLQQQGYTLNPF